MSGSEAAPPCLILTGPTATGKTALAAALADRFPYEMISADSMQVYRGMEIGTGQPTGAELRGHRILGCGVIDPGGTFSVKRFVELCDHAAEKIRERGRVPLFVGGTGMYLRALRRGLLDADREESDQERARAVAIRARLEEEIRFLGSAALHERLERVDPELAARVHPNDPVRIVRGLEVIELEGRKLSGMQTQWAGGAMRFPHRLLILDCPGAELRRRIEARVDAMLRAGWVGEVRRLLDSGVSPEAHCMKALGYREIAGFLSETGEVGCGARDSADDLPAEIIARIKTRTWQFARRQRTWFRRERGAERIDMTNPGAVETISDLISRPPAGEQDESGPG